MLKVKDLKKEFVMGDQKVGALQGVSLTIPTGAFGAIIGKSGSGKSTLLALLGALDKPTSGSINIDGKNIVGMNDKQLIQHRRHKIGFIFQNYNLVPNLTALENVMLPMEFAGIETRKRKERAIELLGQVGITEDKYRRKPTRLSGGEQQRVAIARALANQPKLILADEPTGNLDTATGKMIVDLLKNLAKAKNITIIAVTHDRSIARQAQAVFHLRDGKLISEKLR